MKSHSFCPTGKTGFKASPYLREKIVYAGQLDPYGKCEEIMEKLAGVKVCASSVYRITDALAESLEEDDSRTLPPLSGDDRLYAEVDGSMIHTLEDGWKEVKLARIFKSGDCCESYISRSQYVTHLGGVKEFCEKTEAVLDSFKARKRLIFITDGATWIKNWIEDEYSESISILDFYHACEHLHDFAREAFSDENERKRWTDKQRTLLSESEVVKVLRNIGRVKGYEKEKKKLLDYYESNKNRMNYKYYGTLGCGIIGSGAVESAHRTVIQRRMKLSGQHWTMGGAKNMLKIRTLEMNGRWDKIIDILKSASICKKTTS